MSSSMLSFIDKARWGKAHWLIFASTAVGFFLWGIINTLGYAFYPEYSNVAYIVVVAAAPLLGTLALPWLSDAFMGRKSMYLVTMSLYGIGSLVIALDLLFLPKDELQMVVFLLGYGISMIGVEGEVPIGLALLAEIIPVKQRQKALILSPNFENIGAAAAAAIAYVTYFLGARSYAVDSLSVVFMAMVGLAVAVVLRVLMPESIRWLGVKGKEQIAMQELSKIGGEQDNSLVLESVKQGVSFRGRFAVLVAWSVANYLTWGLMAFVLADYYFVGADVFLVMLVANLGASAAGLLVPMFIDKMDTRNYAMVSFSGAVLSFLPAFAYVILGFKDAPLFYLITFSNLFFITMTWFVRTIYEPLLFQTQRRGLMIGSVRAVAMLAYTASTYATSGFPEWAFVIYGAFLQGVGLVAAAWWKLRGYDVRMKSLESLSAAPRLGQLVAVATKPGNRKKRGVNADFWRLVFERI
ncbi:MAG: MFS transporter [Candidatus Marsarchaeota archaeon]